MPNGLMKRLSKSATDLSPCKKKTRSNSEDEEFEDQSRSESARTDISDEDGDRPGSAQSSVSVPAISLIGSTKRIKFHSRGRSRSEHHSGRVPHERSIAAEIAAVPKTSNFGIFGLLKQKFGLSNRARHRGISAEHGQQFLQEEDGPPQVVRIKCEAEFNPNYNADTESGGSPSPQRRPQVIRRKVSGNGQEREDRPLVIRHQTSEETASAVSSVSAASNQAAHYKNNAQTQPSNPPISQTRQDSRSSFMSILTRSRTESTEEPGQESVTVEEEMNQATDSPECFHSTEDLKQYSTYYNLCVHLKAGHDLAAKDSCGTSDPYVKFLINSKIVHKSKTVYKDLNPFWDERFEVMIEDISVPMDIKVYDYDWGLRDDFMGQAQIQFSPVNINQHNDLVLTLIETGKSEYLGQITLEVKLSPLSPDSPEHRRASQSQPTSSHTPSPARGLELAARKLKPGTWTSMVHIVLVEGRDLLAMDEEGTSDPYCKFRLGNDRYKTKTVYETLNPKWQEQFELYMYEETQELEITVWDRDQRSKDDFMGRSSIELNLLKREVSHHIWLNLEDGAGKLFLIVTISGATNKDSNTFLSNWDHSEKTAELRQKSFDLKRTFKNFDDVGSLVVKVYRAKGLYAADLGGYSDPFCVLELDNTRVQTHTEYKTLDPVWQKVFLLAVPDVHSVIHCTVFDEDKNHKTEFLGKLCIPLLNMKNQEKKWFALKDKTLRCRAKGNFPQIQLEFDLVWNQLRAAYVTLNPKKEIHMKMVEKFKRHVFINNVMRIKAVILAIVDFGSFIQSCLEWEDIPRSVAAFVSFMAVTYYFEPYMAPIGLLLVFLKHHLVTRYIEQKPVDSLDVCSMSDDDEDNEDKEEDKEEKKSIKERLQAIQDVTAMVQNALGYAAHFCEGVKNTFNFSVPFLSWLAIIILSVISIFLFFIPCRVIIMLWGINKFSRQLIMPDTVPNNELLDFLSRVPNDEMLRDAREMKLMHEENLQPRRPATKKKS